MIDEYFILKMLSIMLYNKNIIFTVDKLKVLCHHENYIQNQNNQNIMHLSTRKLYIIYLLVYLFIMFCNVYNTNYYKQYKPVICRAR